MDGMDGWTDTPPRSFFGSTVYCFSYCGDNIFPGSSREGEMGKEEEREARKDTNTTFVVIYAFTVSVCSIVMVIPLL